ncbi:MAG: hypothetical protein ACOYD3_04720 [Kiritimatiellia bacterium]|jgi:hypothetical protein
MSTQHTPNRTDELQTRIGKLVGAGGGTLQLADGVYGLDRTLVLPKDVSLCMTPHAILRALPGFKGDVILLKDADDDSRHHPGGWIRGGVIDGNHQPLTGLKVVRASRVEIADIEIRNATFKGIHVEAGYEVNISHVRCNNDLHKPYAPGSIGIHYSSGDSAAHLAHIIGFETGLRSDAFSCHFAQVHVWNYDPDQGPMPYCFYCNGHCDTYLQCYADSPSIAGFYVVKPSQTFIACRTYYSRWAADNAGAGVLVGPNGGQGTYLGNGYFADPGHKLAKAFDGNLAGATILGESYRDNVVLGGRECRIPSGDDNGRQPPLNVAGPAGLRLTPRATPPEAAEGEPGEIVWVDGGAATGLYIKTSEGWKRARLES